MVTLRNLSVNPDNKVLAVGAGALPQLISLLHSPFERIQEHAVVTIRNLLLNAWPRSGTCRRIFVL